ncbi:hypothetical protein CHUAL_008597 [Chamberlinius hualienensis]
MTILNLDLSIIFLIVTGASIRLGDGFNLCNDGDLTDNGTVIVAAFQHEDPSNSSLNQQDIILSSVDLYEQQITAASAQGAELIVFPEYGITGVSITSSRELIKPYLQMLPTVIPDPDQPWNPCLNASRDEFNVTVLHRLSCSAMSNNLIVVANMGTIVKCNSTEDLSCPTDGVYQFNSDIVFDKNGTIVTTYHKVNLYLEPQFDRPPYPPDYVSTFTHNSITYGLITCFDILWYYPLVQMVESNRINQILMPTAWDDGLPFLTSVQSQQAWSIGLNINLIAANVQRSKDGYRGSGIYSGSAGYINYTYDTSNTNRLILSQISLTPGQLVPKLLPPPIAYFDYTGIIYDDLSGYSFLPLNTTSSVEGNATIVTGNITCSVNYALNELVIDGDYMLASYQGKITLGYGSYILAIEVCSVLYCYDANDPVNTCSKTTSGVINANFTKLNLGAQLNTNYVYPNILRSDLQLVDPVDWSFYKSTVWEEEQLPSNVTMVQLTTNSNFSHSLSVASLYGRRYDLDKS